MAEPYFAPLGEMTYEEGLYLQIAADIRERYAPTPDTVTEDYETKAVGAEFLIYQWLTSTSGGSLTSESIGDLGSSFTQFPAVRSIVANTMPDYFIGSKITSRYIQRA